MAALEDFTEWDIAVKQVTVGIDHISASLRLAAQSDSLLTVDKENNWQTYHWLLRNSGAISEFRPAQVPPMAITNSFGGPNKQTAYSYGGPYRPVRVPAMMSDMMSDMRFLPLKKDAHHIISFVPLIRSSPRIHGHWS
ncbi:hypothetical protein QO004_001618 [Rhizobium mesoamericanum]|uniref:hypothetical protein n=1 Tax=Rhizobium mesoamericanum TaxID=1079800 RepID=UPI0027871495|nr:hypothetical protein [Rhizobium mesoamericanum]MDQ0559836.1 hypothetical protein [Rhizobium mesoamericanum]